MSKFRSSLQSKFSFHIITFAIAIYSIICLFFYYKFDFILKDLDSFKPISLKMALSEHFKNKGKSVAKFLSEELVNPLYNLDPENIFYILKTIKNDPHIKKVYVFDKKGKLIQDGSDKLLGFDQTLSLSTINEVSSPNASKFIEVDGQIIITCPIFLEDNKLGFIKLIYSLDLKPSDTKNIKNIILALKKQANEESIKFLGLLTIVIFLISLTFALFFSSGLKKIILRLSEIAEKFGNGENSFLFPKSRSDELGKLIAAFTKMVDQRKAREEKLRESTELFHDLTLTSPIGIWRSDLEGNCIYINNRSSNIIGVPINNSFGKAWLKNIHPDDKELFSQNWDNAVKNSNNFKFECRFLSPDEKLTEVLGQTIFKENGTGKAVGYIGTIADITNFRTLEANLKKSLFEKEILLKELHHRIKNNLQVVSGLLHLQEENVNDPQLLNILRDSQNRILSMALVHERILESENFSQIDIEKYIRTLVNQLFSIYGSNNSNISLDIQIQVKSFDFDKSIYCGLIINELVSNSLKYAFHNNQNNQIQIHVSNTNSGKTKLTVADNGVGFSQDFSLEKNSSIGLKVVSLLVNSQLEGVLNLMKNNGAKFEIVF